MSEPIGFGTSGLRGPACGFTPQLVAAHVAGFLETACAGAAGRVVAIGADLRPSSPHIAALVAGAVLAQGWTPVWYGVLPTPALALHAMAGRIPAIMVTGSHIPASHNGLKFYRPEGELAKADEAPILAAAAAWSAGANVVAEAALPAAAPDAGERYVRRYLQAFAPGALRGLRIGVFAHSAAGREMLAQILETLGAEISVFGFSQDFVAVDTEAVEPRDGRLVEAEIAARALDAVVSTDGDGDRPLLFDETGRQVNGDVLGALTARALGIETVVTPLTSTSAIEASGWFRQVVRTRIGSPYVVAAMATAAGKTVAGFEANGGFLLQTPLQLPPGRLDPLPTRDAMLPLLAVLAAGMPVSRLVGQLPPRVMKADRLKEIAPEKGRGFVAAMASSAQARAAFDPRLEHPVAIDTTDGTRLRLADGAIVHFRQSGNAPELRCYVEADMQATAQSLLDETMIRLSRTLSTQDS